MNWLNLKKIKYLTLIIILCTGVAFSQDMQVQSPASPTITAPASTTQDTGGGSGGLSSGFNDIKIKDLIEDVKKKLANDPNFEYKVEDVSINEDPKPSLIDVRGKGYLKRGVFQFYKGSLYSIILFVDEHKFDFFTMWKTFKNKWGPPVKIDPNLVRWEDEDYRIDLEKPLKITYIDLQEFNNKKELNAKNKNREEMSRENFLNLF